MYSLACRPAAVRVKAHRVSLMDELNHLAVPVDDLIAQFLDTLYRILNPGGFEALLSFNV